MTRWFRFYDEALNDPKILKLSDNLYRIWVGLLCVASKNDGRLPSLEDLCLMVRIKPEKMQAALNTLMKSGLIDDDEAVLSPHNWNGRQYKSDVTDPTAPARQKAYRERIKHRNATVTDTDPRAETEQIQSRTEQIAVAAAASENLITPEALQLSEKLLVIAGHDPKFWPPGWCGAPMRVQTWLSQGWLPEIIVAAVKGAAARKRGPPANSVQFFENAIAEEIARQSAPIPTVEIKSAPTLTVYNGTSQNKSGSSLTAEIRRELAELESQGANPALPTRAVLRLSN